MPVVQPKVELLAHTPEPLSLVYAAFRQCYHAGFVADMWPRLLAGEISREKQAAFVASIMESGHASPVEHVSFTFALGGVSRALTHQLVRHRIASYSQQSQRYVDGSDFDYLIPPEIRKNPEALERFEGVMREIGSAYRDLKALLEAAGRTGSKANEDARFVLPQATASNIVVTMNCRSLLNFLSTAVVAGRSGKSVTSRMKCWRCVGRSCRKCSVRRGPSANACVTVPKVRSFRAGASPSGMRGTHERVHPCRMPFGIRRVVARHAGNMRFRAGGRTGSVPFSSVAVRRACHGARARFLARRHGRHAG